jgi:hypothetical protein
MEMKSVKFLGWDCVELISPHLTLRVTQSLGPRIIYLALPGGRNILAEVPTFEVPPPIGEPFRVLGGHRVWHGPEMEIRTYLADHTEPVELTPTQNGVHVVQKTDAAGIQKMLDIRLDPDRPQVTVVDALRNQGAWPIETYPWGLTQVRPGGFAILPQSMEPRDQHGLVANRVLTFWPYTRLTDRRLIVGDHYVFVRCDPGVSESFKMGFDNRRGWLGYYVGRTLFVKSVPYYQGGQYSDLGSSNEVYTNDQFLELEVMAPLNTLQPGHTASLTETWDVFPDIDLEPSDASVEPVAETLGLDSAPHLVK